MIVPTNRLLLWFALLLPFAALGGMLPSLTGAVLAIYAAFALVAGIDALSARRRALELQVVPPDIVRLSKGRPGSIPLAINRGPVSLDRIKIGLPLPEDLGSGQEELAVALPRLVANATADWSCTPSARGCFRIDRCFFGVPSTLGLWTMHGSNPCSTEIRVYPDLLSERRRLAALFLNRGGVGLHRQRAIGQGRDFEKLREYIPGDSFDDIHWKATAKRSHPVTKLYQIERTQEILVAIDSSRLSARACGDEPAIERFLASALTLGLAAEQQGDRFGVITFSDRVRRFIRPAGGKAHYDACRDALYTLQPEPATPDFDELCAFVRQRLRRRSLLMILTDLGDPVLSESFLRNVELICRQHLVIVTMIRQPGTQKIFATPDAGGSDDLHTRLGGHLRWQGLRELERSLQRRGVKLLLADNEKLSAELVSRYMSVRARQLL